MTKSRKSKILALALCAGVMSGIYAPSVTYALPSGGQWGGYYPKDEQHVVFDNETNKSESGIVINNPDIKHPAVGNHTDQCGENIYDTDMTLGDFNKVVDKLVDTDENIAEKVDKVSGQVNEINKKIENIDVKDTDTHVKEGAATVADNGDVTMDIVDKNGKDTLKDVTITGLASDKELADQKSELEKADEDLQGQIDDNKTAIDGLDGRVDDLDGKVTDIQEQIDNIDVEDTNTQVNEGTYTAKDDGTVNLDVVDKTTGEIKEDAITIEGLASDSELTTVENQLKDRDQELQADINAKEQQSKDRDKELQANIDAEEAARVEADEQLQANIDAEETARVEADKVLQADINAKEEQSKYRDQQLQGQINDQGQQIGDNTAAIKNHTSVIGVEDSSQLAKEYADTNYISGATDMVEADQRLDAAISDVSTRVDGIENRVDGLEDRIDKVGAMSAAIANLRTMGYDPAAPTEIAVGVGQYRDETGMALGLFHYPNRDFMLSLSVSTSGDEYMGGIGATWKFGRKSPEKVAEIKKAQAEADVRRAEEAKLAKAEEMKKAAKEAKVQAQMERHAKMAAERAAQAEA